ncbi:MAG: ABC transporter substrate-binding protein [Chloroflexi bacterium]|nr:ABC transporter substrate-binding protein [Chloroflexota bacterium]
MRNLIKTVAILTLVSLLLVGCSDKAKSTPGTSFPLTFNDDAGRTVTIAKPATKIISISPAHTETLFALGVAAKVIAVDPFSDYPPEAKSKTQIGGGMKPNIEQIVSLQPDLVVSQVEGQDFFDQLQARGITVIKLSPADMEGIYKTIELLGRLSGAESEAKKLTNDMKKRVDAVVAKTKGTAKPRVFYELDATDPTKPYTPGPGSFIDALITLAGGQNIAAAAKSAWTQFSTEEIIAKDPEIIVLGDALVPFNPQSAATVSKRSGWSMIMGVKKNAIYPIDDNLMSRPGPRIVAGLESLAKIIHPELFP